jgi:uncharacterized protein YbjT (DUF2867 family)
MRILVTGASGFAGSLLVPRLCADGHDVRAFGRDPERVVRALSATRRGRDRDADSTGAGAGPPTIEIVRGDMLSGEGLERALDDVEVAYYLVHSMEQASAEEPRFAERERRAAENFAAASTAAGVRRIVYLGGLLPRRHATGDLQDRAMERVVERDKPGTASRHLASREQVERILLGALADSIALRASIVIGARSRSFRLLVHLIERMPVLALPAWYRFQTQPIDARDVTDMLAACASTAISGQTLDIGGPDTISYGDLLSAIAERMLVSRPRVRLGVNLTGITARVAAAIADEDPELVVPLMEGLQGDLLPQESHASELLGVPLHSLASAIERALAEWEEVEPLAAR